MGALALALLPLLPNAVIMIERLIGNRKSPSDTATGQTKLDNVMGIAQQLMSTLVAQHPGSSPLTNEDLAALINSVVQILKPFGLDHVSTSPTGTLPMGQAAILPVYAGTATFTLTPQIHS